MRIPKSLKAGLPLMALVCLHCGCASVGRDFKYQNTASLELGVTRSSDYQATFGKPNAVETKDNSDGKFELVRYLYAYADMGTARSRLLDLEFRDGVLNALKGQQAMKTYGIVLADNGSNWYVSGSPDERWDNDMLHLLDELTGNDFEAVDTSVLMVDPNSGQAK